MKKGIICVILIVISILSAEAQSVFGKWKSIDAETGKIEAIITVYKENEKAYAKIVDILNPADKDKICIYCKGKNKDKPILGMIILDGLKEDGDEWSDGKILDPKNGKRYACYIKLKDSNTLKLRGYIGISLFGRTEYWKRVE